MRLAKLVDLVVQYFQARRRREERRRLRQDLERIRREAGTDRRRQ